MSASDLIGIFDGVPAVDDDRLVKLFCQNDLIFTDLFLSVPVVLVPLIVQTDLTDRGTFLGLIDLREAFKKRLINIIDIARIDP